MNFHNYGVKNTELHILLTFHLNERKLLVAQEKDDDKSNFGLVLIGVPQSSVLAPFLIYIAVNDYTLTWPTSLFYQMTQFKLIIETILNRKHHLLLQIIKLTIMFNY